jgi:hypothetical protein
MATKCMDQIPPPMQRAAAASHAARNRFVPASLTRCAISRAVYEAATAIKIDSVNNTQSCLPAIYFPLALKSALIFRDKKIHSRSAMPDFRVPIQPGVDDPKHASTPQRVVWVKNAQTLLVWAKLALALVVRGNGAAIPPFLTSLLTNTSRCRCGAPQAHIVSVALRERRKYFCLAREIGAFDVGVVRPIDPHDAGGLREH